MAIKVITAAAQSDADLCNALDPPVSGIHVGGGIHVVIPPDWAARIAAGQDVPGCSYAKVQPDATLVVSDAVQAALLVTAKVAALPVPLQTRIPAFNTELSTATVLVAQAEVIA